MSPSSLLFADSDPNLNVESMIDDFITFFIAGELKPVFCFWAELFTVPESLTWKRIVELREYLKMWFHSKTEVKFFEVTPGTELFACSIHGVPNFASLELPTLLSWFYFFKVLVPTCGSPYRRSWDDSKHSEFYHSRARQETRGSVQVNLSSGFVLDAQHQPL